MTQVLSLEIENWNENNFPKIGEKLIEVLDKIGVDKANILLVGIDGNREAIQCVLENGIAIGRTHTFAGFVEELGERSFLDPLSYAEDYDSSAILVYRADYLREDDESHKYVAREGKKFRDALIAIIQIEKSKE